MSKGRRATATAILLAAGLLLSVVGQASAQTQTPVSSNAASASATPGYAPGEIVIGYDRGVKRPAKTAVRRELDASVSSSSAGVEVLDLPAGTSVADGMAAAESLPQVAYAEPNYSIAASASPNDPMFDEMWSLGLSHGDGHNSGIGTPRVWNLTTGSPSITVAVVDSGVDSSHPDLSSNMWTNGSELPGNGTDDDGNGYIDDSLGWDWVASDNDPNDELGHGTQVAGIIGARGNNSVGVVGVSWNVRLMPLRVLDAAGSGWTSDVAAAFAYAGQKGADVVNASLAGPSLSQAMLQAITDYPDTLFVVAAGNSSDNVDVAPSYPCVLPPPNVVCVAATDRSNQLSNYSSYGPASVDLAAPGDQILSTWPGGTYNEGWGTSFATPHVSGLAALLMARHPEASAASVLGAIMGGVEPLPSLAGRTISGGRLNAAGAFEQMGDVVPQESAADRLLNKRDDDGPRKRCSSGRRGHGRRHRHHRRACRSGRTR